MVFYILNCPIALLSPVRYKILADIESFAFLLLVVIKTLPMLTFFAFKYVKHGPFVIKVIEFKSIIFALKCFTNKNLLNLSRPTDHFSDRI